MLLQRDPPLDFKALVLDFIRWGWTLKAIAEAINVPPSTLKSWWYDGSVPGYEDGRALVKLHAQEKRRHSDPVPSGAAVQGAR